MEVTLAYKNEEYEDKEVRFDITFTNQRMVKEFSQIVADVTLLEKLHQIINTVTERKAAAIVGKDKEEAKAECQKIDDEAKELYPKYVELCSPDLFNRRVNLAIEMVKANHGGAIYQTAEFWDERVDPTALNEFLAACIMKDKKKV